MVHSACTGAPHYSSHLFGCRCSHVIWLRSLGMMMMGPPLVCLRRRPSRLAPPSSAALHQTCCCLLTTHIISRKYMSDYMVKNWRCAVGRLICSNGIATFDAAEATSNVFMSSSRRFIHEITVIRIPHPLMHSSIFSNLESPSPAAFSLLKLQACFGPFCPSVCCAAAAAAVVMAAACGR